MNTNQKENRSLRCIVSVCNFVLALVMVAMMCLTLLPAKFLTGAIGLNEGIVAFLRIEDAPVKFAIQAIALCLLVISAGLSLMPWIKETLSRRLAVTADLLSVIALIPVAKLAACLPAALYIFLALVVVACVPLIAAFFCLAFRVGGKRVSDLEYLRFDPDERHVYTVICFVLGFPRGIWNLSKKIGKLFAKLGVKIGAEFADIFLTFKNGDWKTRVSYLIMGFGSIARGQILRGLLFLLMEVVFIGYMLIAGIYWLSELPNLGKVGPVEEYNWIYDTYTTSYHDNSFKILLYGVLTIFFIIGFVVTWRMNIKQNKICQQILATGKKLKSGKDDLRSLVDDQFHKTLLSLPLLGILIFTVMPIIFMILVAFTNYDSMNDGYINNLFHWVGLDNWNTMLTWGDGSVKYGATLGEILAWTLIWAFFATFSNYFLGMGVAMIINKKGIKLKKLWRTCLVLTIAVPQFISLLYVSKMFASNGIVNGLLMDLGWIQKVLPFWTDKTWARVTVIIINIWIGIPHLMLMATGILMNIPADLYESAKVDGAGVWKQYTKITLPYMLFVTGPYLLTSFIGNMNNFNVIYLLTGGGPSNLDAAGVLGAPGETDLLITWLFKMVTISEPAAYNLASVIGIIVFVVVAGISLIVYNVMPSTRNEEDFQ